VKINQPITRSHQPRVSAKADRPGLISEDIRAEINQPEVPHQMASSRMYSQGTLAKIHLQEFTGQDPTTRFTNQGSSAKIYWPGSNFQDLSAKSQCSSANTSEDSSANIHKAGLN
jgi:hypothetical protein